MGARPARRAIHDGASFAAALQHMAATEALTMTTDAEVEAAFEAEIQKYSGGAKLDGAWVANAHRWFLAGYRAASAVPSPVENKD